MKIIVLILGMLSLPYTTYATSHIEKCYAKSQRCIVKAPRAVLEATKIGDSIVVLDERAKPQAQGWIIKSKGSYAVIAFKTVFKLPEAGYPVVFDKKKVSSKKKQGPKKLKARKKTKRMLLI